MTELVDVVLGGTFHAAVLFLVAAGLQLVFGVQKIVNLACGSFYALGAYFGITAVGLALGAQRASHGHFHPSASACARTCAGVRVSTAGAGPVIDSNSRWDASAPAVGACWVMVAALIGCLPLSR